MQEVFKKIKERLEEEVKYQNEEAELAPPFCELTFDKARRKMAECYEHAIEIVNQVAEEYNQSLTNNNQSLTNGGWIPCSERLPEEEYDTVLAVTDKNHYCVAVYTTEHGFRTMDIDCEGVFVAWQPLPEPYRGE